MSAGPAVALPADFTPEIHTSTTLLQVARQQRTPQTYFRNLLFPRNFFAATDTITLSDVVDGEQISMFCLPEANGRPLRSDYERVGVFRPGYTKLDNALRPQDTARGMVGELPLLSGRTMTLQEKLDAAAADTMRRQRQAIERLIEWMCAAAALEARYVMQSADYPAVSLDFGRDPSHVKVLTGSDQFGLKQGNVNKTLEWAFNKIATAELGGAADRVTFGAAAWAAAKQDDEFMKQFDKRIALIGEDTDRVRLSAIGNKIERSFYVGTISGGTVECWVTSHFYRDNNGAIQLYMSPNDILVTASQDLNGHVAFGGIQDFFATNLADIFPRMYWNNKDGTVNILTQSAPIAIPVRPNCTVKVTVTGGPA